MCRWRWPLGLGISLLIYLVLQLSFLVSVPPDLLSAGWANLSLTQHGGPLAALAIGLGLGWMVVILLIDAALSPSATAMAYLGVSARISWMMGRCRLLPKPFGHTNRRGVPDVSIIASLVVGSAMLLIGAGWQQVVSFLTAAQMIALAMGPPSLLALRRQLPEETWWGQVQKCFIGWIRGAVGNCNIGLGLYCSQLGGDRPVVRPCWRCRGLRAGHWGAEFLIYAFRCSLWEIPRGWRRGAAIEMRSGCELVGPLFGCVAAGSGAVQHWAAVRARHH